jgi:hypothetical protein
MLDKQIVAEMFNLEVLRNPVITPEKNVLCFVSNGVRNLSP